LNTGCVIEHNAVIGPYVHIAGGAVLAGAVIVEEGALVAIGAKVCPFVRIGAWSTLGAGAVALRDVPPQSLAVGVPARAVVKEQPA
jgi:acetyltransferase EpsM